MPLFRKNGESLLKQVADDVSVLKQKINVIEEELYDISADLHDIRPGYIKKLKKIEKGKFLSRKDFEKSLEEE